MFYVTNSNVWEKLQSLKFSEKQRVEYLHALAGNLRLSSLIGTNVIWI